MLSSNIADFTIILFQECNHTKRKKWYSIYQQQWKGQRI